MSKIFILVISNSRNEDCPAQISTFDTYPQLITAFKREYNECMEKAVGEDEDFWKLDSWDLESFYQKGYFTNEGYTFYWKKVEISK